MDELATTVSDILNQAAGGIGDISEWLASDGLTGYTSVMIARQSCTALMCMVSILACVVFFRWIINSEIDLVDSFAVFLVAIVAVVVMILSAFVLVISLPDLVGWLVSPDGMLLDTLVSALGN